MQSNPRVSSRLPVAILSLSAAMLLAAAGEPPAAAPSAPSASPSPSPRERILVFSKTGGFRHESIPDGIACVRELMGSRYEVVATEDSGAFTKDNLAKFKAVVFLSTTGDILDDAQQDAFEGFIRSGGGFAGIHAAADTEHTWPWYGKLVGAYFKTHPHIQPALVKVEDRTHRSTRMLPAEWRRTDEWYVYNENPRGRVKVLASLDDSTVEGADMGGDHPIAWYHDFEGGRAWYTGGGHTKESFQEPLFRQHVEGGILWAAGAADEAPGSKSPGSKNPGSKAPDSKSVDANSSDSKSSSKSTALESTAPSEPRPAAAPR